MDYLDLLGIEERLVHRVLQVQMEVLELMVLVESKEIGETQVLRV